jgi:hypothetical protein
MNPIPELVPHLKQLRLSGILDSLEARNRQAIESKLAYTEFLAILMGDEVARREQKSSLTLSGCPSSTAPWCTIWPPGATCASARPC